MAALSPERYINLMPLLDTTQVIRTVPGTPFGLEVKEEYADTAIRILRRTGHMKAWRRAIISVADPSAQEELDRAAFERFGPHHHYVKGYMKK